MWINSNYESVSNLEQFRGTSFVDAWYVKNLNFSIQNLPFFVEVKMCFLVENTGNKIRRWIRTPTHQNSLKSSNLCYELYKLISSSWFLSLVYFCLPSADCRSGQLFFFQKRTKRLVLYFLNNFQLHTKIQWCSPWIKPYWRIDILKSFAFSA